MIIKIDTENLKDCISKVELIKVIFEMQEMIGVQNTEKYLNAISNSDYVTINKIIDDCIRNRTIELYRICNRENK